MDIKSSESKEVRVPGPDQLAKYRSHIARHVASGDMLVARLSE